MIRVKICGINDAAAFDAAVAAAADWVGFVFFPRSPRVVSPAEAAALSARHPGGPARVGLFVAPTDADVAEALATIHLDVLQVYVDAARAAELRQRFQVPVWRAVGVADAADLPTEAAGVDGLVIEPTPPPEATRPGGNAVALDWSLLAGWTAPVPWLLAGGLTPGNVAGAIRRSGARAVDVSSGVERQRGVKDPALIGAFVSAARAGNQALRSTEGAEMAGACPGG
jgi:phosphoribosylanthranilate isomerase